MYEFFHFMVKNIQIRRNKIVTCQQKHIRMCKFIISKVQNIQIHANEIITLSQIDMYELVKLEITLRQIVFKN